MELPTFRMCPQHEAAAENFLTKNSNRSALGAQLKEATLCLTERPRAQQPLVKYVLVRG